MGTKSWYWRSLGGLWMLGLVAGAGAAQAQGPHLTLRAFASNVDLLTGRTSETRNLSAQDSFVLNVFEKKQWYGADLDARLSPNLSLDLTASQGKLEEVLFTSHAGQTLAQQRTSTLRYNTLSLLLHPVPGHLFDFYLGPSLGQAHFDRAFASSEDERAQGGKVGIDLQLGETRILLSAQLSILTSGFRVADGSQKHNVTYRVAAAGLGYRF